MALLSLQGVSMSGVAPTYAAVSASDTLPVPSDNVWLHVKNNNASPTTVTVVVPGNNSYGQPNPDIAVSVPASGERLIGPLPRISVETSTKVATVTYSVTASVTAGAFTL